MIRVVVCDDEKAIRADIVRSLGRYQKENGTEFEIIEFSSADTLVNNYPGNADLLLLDIYMPGIDGMAAAGEIRAFDSEVCIIFITTEYQRAIDGYKVRAFGFIRKPVSYEEFSHEVSCAVKSIERNKAKEHYLNARSSGKPVRIPVSSISYCEVRGHRMSLCIDGEIREFRFTIGELEEELKQYGFFRCHASFLVNSDAISEIRQQDILLRDGTTVPISQRRRKAFMAELSEYIGEQI